MTRSNQAPAATPSASDRTRQLLVNCTRTVLHEGGIPTVANVAARANVSRATAYRYFSSNEAILLAATVPEVQPVGLDASMNAKLDQGAPLPEEAAQLVKDTAVWAFDHESELRDVLALTLSQEGQRHGLTRKGISNRGTWIGELVDRLPDHVPAAARKRLAASLVPLFGADALVWTRDVAELEPAEAREVMSWMAQVLVEATLAGDCGSREQEPAAQVEK